MCDALHDSILPLDAGMHATTAALPSFVLLLLCRHGGGGIVVRYVDSSHSLAIVVDWMLFVVCSVGVVYFFIYYFIFCLRLSPTCARIYLSRDFVTNLYT